VLEGAPDLKVISRCGTGMDSVDLDAARARGIEVRNTPDAPALAVAELTMGLILGALRNIARADRSLRAGQWEPLSGGLLNGRRVGLVGHGRIGRRVGALCRAFGAETMAHDPAPPPPGDDVARAGLDDLLAWADIITLHVPGGPSTANMIDRAALAGMKPGAILVNTARGGLVDEEALAEALRDGRLRAAALDTFAEEPYAGPLTGLDNAVLTAHMGSRADESRRNMEREAADNLLDALRAQGALPAPASAEGD